VVVLEKHSNTKT